MSDSERTDPAWPAAVASLAAGPAIAFLHEVGLFSPGPSGTLWPIGLVVLVAGAGLLVGLRVASHPPRWLGTMAVLANGIVVLFYGFLLLFFGLGGSR